MESEATAIALSACALFGYGFFLGHWAGRKQARRERQLMLRTLRSIRFVARMKGAQVVMRGASHGE